MRQRFLIFGAVAAVIVVLLLINAASFVEIGRPPENELSPDRSTYNGGPTGTRALYDFLQESGQRVIRWQESPAALNTLTGKARPAVWVVVGDLRQEYTEEEVHDLLLWVERGGRLVVIDRNAPPQLLPPSAKWHFEMEPATYGSPPPAPDDQNWLTFGVKPTAPSQPSLLVQGVNQVQASRLASTIMFGHLEQKEEPEPDAENGSSRTERYPENGEPPPIPGVGSPTEPRAPAPVVYLSQPNGPLLIDYPHGAGRIVVLTDPFMVANAGLKLADNLLLARNLVGTNGGLVAFDEFHQGRAASQNHLAAYFAGTPVLPIVAQLSLIVLAVLWTRSRRFGRSLPLVQTDRRSKLEYVASMAELQQRSRAYDLAIENIYQRTRRALARYAGVDGTANHSAIAKRVAARSKVDEHQLDTVMRQCEDAINGDPTSARQALSLVARLREIEDSLGLRFRRREAKQAREL
jgi:hypothetical protein